MQWGRQFQWLVKLNFSHFFFSTTCSPAVPQLSEHHASSSPAIRHVSAYPVSDSPVHVTGVVTDELIRSCVTPRKVDRVREALDAESERDRCAIRLLKQFFTKEELAMGNTEGNFNKSPLDRTRLHFTRWKVRHLLRSRCSYLFKTSAICGLSLLLVLSLAPRGFSPGTPVFSYDEPLCGCATSKSLFIIDII